MLAQLVESCSAVAENEDIMRVEPQRSVKLRTASAYSPPRKALLPSALWSSAVFDIALGMRDTIAACVFTGTE
jgi:hypothetical protein